MDELDERHTYSGYLNPVYDSNFLSPINVQTKNINEEAKERLNFLLRLFFRSSFLDFEDNSLNISKDLNEDARILCFEWVKRIFSKQRTEDIVNRLYRIAERIESRFDSLKPFSPDDLDYSNLWMKNRLKFLLENKFNYIKFNFRCIIAFKENVNKTDKYLCIKWIRELFSKNNFKEVINELYQTEKIKRAFFNQPEAKANFNFWADAEFWSIEEFVALVLEKDPRIVSYRTIEESKKDDHWVTEPLFINKYKGILGHATKRFESKLSKGITKFPPLELLQWAKNAGYNLPQELVEIINKSIDNVHESKNALDKEQIIKKYDIDRSKNANKSKTEKLEAIMPELTKTYFENKNKGLSIEQIAPILADKAYSLGYTIKGAKHRPSNTTVIGWIYKKILKNNKNF